MKLNAWGGTASRTLLVAIIMTLPQPLSATSHVKLTQVQKLAACVVRTASARSEMLVRSEPGTDDEEMHWDKLSFAIKRCDRNTGRDGQFPSRAMFRGLLAERLWLNTTSLLSDSLGGPKIDPNYIDYDIGFDKIPSLRDNYRLAFCVADSQSVMVDHLLRSEVGSFKELEAFDTLKVAISRCLPVGRSVSLNQLWLRASLAEQLYRRFPSLSAPPSRSSVLLRKNE